MKNDQQNFFDLNKDTAMRPLASRMRPTQIEDVVGQDHLLSEGKLLHRMISADKISSMVLYGPPGSGKTTLAYVISQSTNSEFETLNATTAGVKDIRAIVSKAEDNARLYRKKTILFIDEIHRFNTAQQDALLPYVEDGIVTIIGATTENPYFEINSPLISRLTVFTLKMLADSDIIKLLHRALSDEKAGYSTMDIQLNEDAAGHIARIAAGDARSALNALELAVLTTKPDKTGKITIDLDIAQDCVQQRAMRYDKDRDNHYDTISAFIKSMRGSDPHAAVFYLAKMILAGEDVKFIARRMMILASEDIGNADPYALTLAVSAFHASHAIGLPEAQLILAQTATYLACAPKSNASTMAIGAAQADIKGGIDTLVPLHLRDSHYMSKEKLGHGVGYKYAHNYEDGYVAQSYLPDSIKNKKYYFPKDIGEEKRLKAILDHIDTIKEKKEEG